MSPQELQDAIAQLEAEKREFEGEKAQYEREKSEFENERKDSGVEYKLFIGNLDDSSNEQEIEDFTCPYGTVKEVHLLRDSSGSSKRSCFVKFYSKASADACLNALNSIYRDKNSPKTLVVRYADKTPSYQHKPGSFSAPNFNPYGPYTTTQLGSSYGPARTGGGGGAQQHSVGIGSGRGPPGANLYVNNLGSNSSEQDVQRMFADFGTVLSVKVFPDMNYGFVSYDNAQSAQYAMQSLNGLQLGDNGERSLQVTLKKERGESSSRFSPY